jgi:hypothetical protein
MDGHPINPVIPWADGLSDRNHGQHHPITQAGLLQRSQQGQ